MTTIDQLRKLAKEKGMKFGYEHYTQGDDNAYYFSFNKNGQVLSCRSDNEFKTCTTLIKATDEWIIPDCFEIEQEGLKWSSITKLLFYDNKYIPMDKMVEFIEAQ
jgi:hypothetical protein